MAKASDNAFPSILITEGTEPAAPAAGKQRLYIDSSSHKLMRTDSSGTEIEIGSTSLATDTLWDAAGDLVVGTGANTAGKLAVGADSTVLTVSPSTHVPVWSAPAAGGGITHAYAGYNSVGGSNENLGVKIHAKQVVLAANCFIASIGAYVKGNDDAAIQTLSAALYDEAASKPNLVLAYCDNYVDSLLAKSASGARWIHIPIGYWAVAGTYWIAVYSKKNATKLDIYYDTSGSDRTNDQGAGNSIADWGTGDGDSTKKYSIRASTLT